MSAYSKASPGAILKRAHRHSFRGESLKSFAIRVASDVSEVGHYTRGQAIEWIKTKCPTAPTMLLERDYEAWGKVHG